MMKAPVNCIVSKIKTSRLHQYIAPLLLFVFILSTVVFSQAATAGVCKGKNKKKHSGHTAAKLVKTYTVSGKVTQTSRYCGGARPPEELVKKLAIPVAYPNKKFYIRQGKTNSINAKIIDSFVTGSTGSFSIQLSPGTYSMIVEEQVKEIKPGDYTKKYEVADSKCLQDWWAKPYYLLEVKDSNIGQLNFVFNHRCYISSDIPCITYNGPLHP